MIQDIVMLEQDPDFMRWGCRLFHTIPLISSGYYIEPIPQDVSSVYQGQGEYSVIENSGVPGSVENDEIVAQALQEEFSQLAMRESPGYSTAADEESKVAVDQQNWRVPPPNYYWPGNSSTSEEGDNNWVKSSPVGDTDGDFCSYPQQPAGDYEYAEMGHPLNQMVPIPMGLCVSFFDVAPRSRINIRYELIEEQILAPMDVSGANVDDAIGNKVQILADMDVFGCFVSSHGFDREFGFLPEGFNLAILGRGLDDPWCNKGNILSHHSIRQLLIHCSCNSELESICCEVPVLCFPLSHAQFMISILMEKVGELGSTFPGTRRLSV
ncbi:hypothetical protein MLD38_020372 [Melastoma candidum]|uniref:Uncharacterized protein n=1 Tax=Melastoma candidum TaxID=119954 RepID=A0ACB9QCW5_9MYRT|nr:hypothetical protein MLD38_020372 [Melastoma candidum]